MYVHVQSERPREVVDRFRFSESKIRWWRFRFPANTNGTRSDRGLTSPVCVCVCV